MEIRIEKLDARRSQAVVMRDDKVTLRVAGYGPSQPLPHDLAHYVVEKELALRRALLGQRGRRRDLPGHGGAGRPAAPACPRALARAVQANSRSLTEAEVIVGLMVELMKNKVPQPRSLPRRLSPDVWLMAKDSELRTVTAVNLQRIDESLGAMARRWADVKIGDALVVRW